MLNNAGGQIQMSRSFAPRFGSLLVLGILACFNTSSTLAQLAQKDSKQEISIQTDVVYGHKAGMALTYDILAPENANGATVVFIVSGGWRSGWISPERILPMFQFLLDEGFTVMPVRHGSAPWFKVPEAIADVRRAMRHIRFNAKSYQLDPERIGVWGQSAGGHIGLMIGLGSDDGDENSGDPIERSSNRVAAVVAYYPLTDLRGLSGPNERIAAFDFNADEEPNVSPILFVSEDDPPVLLVHGDKDAIVPIEHSQNLELAMSNLSLSVDFVTIEGAGHSFDGEDYLKVQRLTKEFFVSQLVSGINSNSD